VAAFSYAIFGVIGRLERRILDQNDELAARNRELEALLLVGQAATSSSRLTELLDQALDVVLSVTSAEAAEAWLTAASGDLELARHRGVGSQAFAERTAFRLGEGLPGVAAQTGEPVVVHDLAADPRFVRTGVVRLGFQTFCAFPLRHRGEVVGVLGVAARDPSALTGAAERRLLEAIGEQLAMGIANSRLHERVLDRAVLEERERIAHELHDGLAQVLGYISTQAMAIRKHLSSGRIEAASAEVSAIQQAAQRVYGDVREAILGLRVPSAGGGLVPGLRAYLRDYGQMAGVTLRLEADEEAEGLRLPSSTEIQLLRIVQEALSNVRKHAAASHVSVECSVEADELVLAVSDDGRGFDLERPLRTGWPHFGLQTMRERAHAIGGTLELRTAPQAGTSVVVRVPLERAREVSLARLAG
jgi:nitrate/nitrite-specific signal transduction histidine kinase